MEEENALKTSMATDNGDNQSLRTKKPLPKKLWHLMVVLGILVFFIPVAKGFAGKVALSRFAKNGEFDQLVSFVVENNRVEARQSRVEYAIELIAGAGNPNYCNKLTQAALEHSFDGKVVGSMLEVFKANTQSVGDLNRTIDLYLKYGYRAEEQFAHFFRAFTPSELESAFISSVVNAYEQEGTKHAISISRSLTLVAPFHIMTKLEGALMEVRQAEEELKSITDSVFAIKAELEELQDFIKLSPDPTELYFYVVQQVDRNIYEIAWAEWSGYYGGYIPSSTRAFLITTNTSYSSRQWATLAASLMSSTEKVTVKEEYGGFTQEWEIYIEADMKAIKERNEKLQRLESALEKNQQEEKRLRGSRDEMVNTFYDVCYPSQKHVTDISNKDGQGSHDTPFEDFRLANGGKYSETGFDFGGEMYGVPEAFNPIWEDPRITYMWSWHDVDKPHSFVIGTTGIKAPSGKVYIEGLAAVYEGTVEYNLLDGSGNVVKSGYTNATNSLGWGYFIIELADSGYESIEIFYESMTGDGDETYLRDKVTVRR